jgi:alpha-L-rhamnosidase
MRKLMILLIGIGSAIASAGSGPAVSHLACEGAVEPGLIDTKQPRFSWRLVSPDRGARQSAYQLRVTEIAPDGHAVDPAVETARQVSDQSQWVAVPAFTPKPKARYQWQVRVWDESSRDCGWSAPATFATGVLGAGWPAAWLGNGVTVARNQAPRARYFRTEFTVKAPPGRARLYLSAFGLVEPWLNGRKVTADHFLPGWPDYRRRVFYVSYDVTAQVHSGANAFGLILGDGWYSGTMLVANQSGSQPLVSAFLELTDGAGATTIVATDGQWQWAEGPIIEQSIYHGETFDARRDDPEWSRAGGGTGWSWHPVQVQGIPAVVMTARGSPPVREIAERKPIARRELAPGVFLYDLGQNMVGWARLKVRAAAGQEVKMRFGEMLEADGTLHTANLRSARATARYIARGGGLEIWEPRFTYFGFRYVEVTGVAVPDEDAVTGIVLHSDLPRIGFFECSSPLLNQLYANTLWGQKGNFLEVPTDCPQRDERLGWTGDAQVFCPTANYNFASGGFYRQWLAALRDGFRDEPGGASGFPDVAPDTGLSYGSAGWGDAAVIVPYVTWLHTGDRRLLEENFDAIQRWIDAQARDWPEGIRHSTRSYGDWLAPGFPAWESPTPYVLIATAYYARVTDLAARIAAELGRTDAAQRDRALLVRIKAAFAREFIASDGRVTSDAQTAYLLALGFDLVPADLIAKAAAQLERTVVAKDGHLATGFLGTPLLAPVLTATAHPDLAYRVLLQESYPGWLFSVKNGATTVWERWDSWTPGQGFHPEGMNSFNHYAYGSIVGWFYETIAGLKPEASAPGWKHFHIAPVPGGGLTQAKATVETPYGVAGSSWRIAGGRFELEATIPPNTEAVIELPVSDRRDVTEGGRALSELREAENLGTSGGHVTLTLPAGVYHFSMPR